MPNENIARGIVNMTPIVTIAATSDVAAKEVIHHDFSTIGSRLEYSSAGDEEKWYYNASTSVSTSANLISGSFTDTGTIANDDKVKFLFVKYSEKQEINVTIYIALGGEDPAAINQQSISLNKGESFIIKLKSTEVDDIHVAVASGSGPVICEVAAIIDDISAGGGG